VFANHEPGGQITVQAGDVRVDAVDTRFCVVVSGANTYIAVPQPTGGKGTHPGSVQITADGKQTTLQAGHETTLGPGQPGGVRSISAAEQRRWNALSTWP
jgi:ferric-dicitrate binding protein FerR (iron transport regulator)